jgi:signal transduction histidine kinase/HPt (histidine-containing phosphotransfer) domain-containing protein/ActR/RegA family two-component response regulator
VLGRIRGASIRAQLLGLVTGVAAVLALLVGLEAWNQHVAAQALKHVRDRSLAAVVDLKAVSDAYAVDAVDTAVKVAGGTLPPAQGVQRLREVQRQLEGQWPILLASSFEGERAERLALVAERRKAADALIERLVARMDQDDLEGLRGLVHVELYPIIEPMTQLLQVMVDDALVETDLAVSAELQRQERFARKRGVAVALAIVLLGLVARSIVRGIYRGVEALKAQAQSLRDGSSAGAFSSIPAGELAEVMEAMQAMQQEIVASELQLRAAAEQAEAANKAKSVFVATMSHEIRTPLIGVTGMLEVLSHSGLNAEQQRIVGVIEHSADALLQIIGDVLDFSKIEADRLSLDPEPVDIALLVRTVAANFEAAASSKGLVLAVSIEADVGRAYWVDPLRLRQVLSNLLSNALKFTTQGRIDVRLARQVCEEESDILRLEVADTGIGVTPEQVERLFQPFTQAEASTTRRFGGTGLGLSICKRLVEMMGGHLHMHGVPDAGSTVTLTLPLRRAPDESVALRKSADLGAAAFRKRTAPGIEEARRAGQLVLLADDHPTNREVLSRQIGIAGYACETAVNGADALAKLTHGHYGLLLTDLHMPLMDGLELARAWRELERSEGRPRMPVLAISAAVSTEDVSACIAAGMDGHLPKPLPVVELAKALDRHLGGPLHPAAGEAPAAVPTVAAAPGLAPGPAYDLAALEELTGGDAVLIAEVIADFVASCRSDLVELQRLLPEAPDEARRQAHRIKGAARMVGAREVVQAAAALEEALARGQAGDAAPLAVAIAALSAAPPDSGRGSGTSS